MSGTTPWPTPEALLLDFGGVIMFTAKPDGGRQAAVTAVANRLARSGHHLPLEHLAQSLQAGRTALKHWKHAASRRRAPRELTPAEIVGDFLAADLPDGPRELLLSESAWLLDQLATTISTHTVRPGIPELLAATHERQIPVGIVSNAHSGASHRRLLAAHGLATQIGVQIYSDEVGVRKPNPAIMQLATDALGVRPERCWYVGDTLDRDVVAGRRAGIGTVLLTRSQHTDSPPFPVREQPDAVYSDPRGLLEAFQAATTPTPQPQPRATQPDPHRPQPGQTAAPGIEPATQRAGLLIDHGGVISTSQPDPVALREFATDLATLLSSPAAPVDPRTVLRFVTAARTQEKTLKYELGHEVSPRHFWVDLVGEQLSVRQRALLHAEAGELTYRLGILKSRRTLREGVLPLLTACRDRGMPVAVVSNTVSGRAVRAICAAHGLEELIGAYLCSDEFGARKPAAAIVEAALHAVAADPAESWFLGDKPAKDGAAATAAGIKHRVLVRGGSTAEHDLQAAVQTGLATAVVDTPGDLRDLILTEKTLLPV